jgi:hypothetical protein
MVAIVLDVSAAAEYFYEGGESRRKDVDVEKPWPTNRAAVEAALRTAANPELAALIEENRRGEAGSGLLTNEEREDTDG